MNKKPIGEEEIIMMNIKNREEIIEQLVEMII